MAIELEGLEFKIEAKSDGASKSIDALVRNLERLKNATNGLRKLNNISEKLGRLNESLKRFHIGNTEKIEKLSHSLQSLSNVSNVTIPESLPKRINDIVNASKQLDDSYINRLERLGSALKSLNATGNIRTLSLKMPNTNQYEPATSGIEETTSKIQEINKGLNNAVNRGNNLKSIIFRGVGGALSNVSSKVNQISKSFSILPTVFNASLGGAINNISSAFGNFLQMLERIAIYRVVKSIISQLTQGVMEGIKALYQYSLIMGGTFANSMDRLATSAQYLRNSLGAIAAPIISAIVPAIDFLINKIATALNFLNMFFSRLSGANSFIRARKSAKSFGKSLTGIGKAARKSSKSIGRSAGGLGNTAKNTAKDIGGAAKSVGKSIKKSSKEIRDATLGIDELNIITQKTFADIGSGKLHSPKLRGLGKYGRLGRLGGFLPNDGPDYGSMFERAPIEKNISDFVDRLKKAFLNADWKELGKLLGNKVNEIVNRINWNKLGNKFGRGIDSIVKTSYSFLSTVDFNNIGSKIANFLNFALESIDFNVCGRLITKSFTIIPDTIIGVLKDLNFGSITNSISNLIIGMCNEATYWIKKYNWSTIGETVWQKIKDTFLNIKFGEITKNISDLLLVIASSIVKLLGGFIGTILVDMCKPFGKLGKLFKEYIINPICEAISSDKYKFQKSGADIVSYIKEGWDKSCQLLKNIGMFIVKVKNDSNEWWRSVKIFWNGINDKIVIFQAKIKNDSREWWNNTKLFWNSIGGKIVIFQAKMNNDAGIWWGNVKTYWNNLGSKFVEFQAGIKNDARTWWSNVQRFWNNIGDKTVRFKADVTGDVQQWRNKINTLWNSVVGSISARFNVRQNARGGILNRPQIFGRIGNTFLSGGEAGREAVLPLEHNTQWMDVIANKVKNGLSNEHGNDSSQLMMQVVAYLSNLDDILSGIAYDMKRQADKKEHTTVQIGNRAIADAVISQQNADGYRFMR